MVVEIAQSAAQPGCPGQDDVFDRKIHELIDLIHDCYGYDFRDYAFAPLKRRVQNFLQARGMSDVNQVVAEVAADRAFFFNLLSDLTISTTELFRDATLYHALSRYVLPVLRTFPVFKVWHAGCSTGEEVYSMVIWLHEHGLLQRATVYATDINRQALRQAKTRIVSSRILKRDSYNYFASGMRHSLTDYWYTQHGYSLLDKSLSENIVFAEHNLATDAAFSEMQLIFCRNVLIYFNRELQNRALELFRDCLSRQGMLCLGMKESLLFSSVARDFTEVSRPARIFQKKTRMLKQRYDL